MIKKSLIAALVFLLLHALFSRITHLGNSQHIWQDNFNKAQRYIYSRDTTLNVIVGSSLSNRLVMDSLPGFYNLALQGQNIYDGLAIIFRKGHIPPKVFIEMNITLGRENKSFTGSLFSPLLYNMRKVLPSLRDEYQPVGQLGKIMMNMISSIQPDSKLLKSPPVPPEVFERMLEIRTEEYSQAPSDEVLHERQGVLRNYVSTLEERGAEVIFFEMPVNERISNLARPCAIREAFLEIFPPDRYRYISMPDCKDYITRDGEHLGPSEALAYTCFLKSEIESIDRESHPASVNDLAQKK
jgi:hypothetical protein